jgi:ubiquinone/menaquinone biosynthesis C-methylase UbiE
LERRALATAADLAAPAKSERLLDVATGTGGLLRELSRRSARPAEVVGIDRSTSMLAVAAARGFRPRGACCPATPRVCRFPTAASTS